MIDNPTNEELCRSINRYWRERGFDANARVELRPVDIGQGLATYRSVVVSDLVNGRPRKRVDSREL